MLPALKVGLPTDSRTFRYSRIFIITSTVYSFIPTKTLTLPRAVAFIMLPILCFLVVLLLFISKAMKHLAFSFPSKEDSI